MPILKKCSDCEREGGYAEDPSDDVCARCKNTNPRDKSGRFKAKNEDGGAAQ